LLRALLKSGKTRHSGQASTAVEENAYPPYTRRFIYVIMSQANK
jgi:hypothetical protein